MLNLFNNSYSNKQQNQVENATSDFSTLQKARQDLVGEIQAIIEYDEHIQTTTNRLAKQTWQNIKDEELAHVGELLALLNYLDPTQIEHVEAGVMEFNKRLEK